MIGYFTVAAQSAKSDGSLVSADDGYYSYMYGDYFSGNLLAVNITGPTRAWYAMAKGGGDIYASNFDCTTGDKGASGLRIYEGSTKKAVGTTTTDSMTYAAWTSSDGTDDAVLTVSTSDMYETSFYSSALGWSTGTGGYDTSPVSSGYLPKVKAYGSASDLEKAIESVLTAQGIDVDITPLNIEIPDNGVTATVTSLQATIQTASIHAGGVETLTIEFTDPETVESSSEASAVSTTLALLFSGVNAAEEMASGEPSDIIVTVYDEEGAVVATTTLANTVLTIPYDYNSELELTLDNGAETASYIIQPSDYQRKVLVWGDDYYLIRSDGLTNQDGEVLTASGWSDAEDADALTILNLADGQALSDDGQIYDLESGTSTGNVSETVAEAAASSGTADDYTVVETAGDSEDVESEGFLTENQAIYSFSTDAGQVESYRNFSYIISDSGVTRQETMLLFKDGSSVGFSPDVELDPFGILYDTYLGETYLAVLSEGELVTYSFGDTLTWPEEVSTSGIAQMSNTLNTDQTILIILYTDGSAIVFDYLSGEILNTFDSEVELSEGGFLSYLIGAFSHWASGLTEGPVIDAADASSLITTLSENPYSKEDLEAVMGTSEAFGTAGASFGGSDDTDGVGTEEEGIASDGDTASAAAQASAEEEGTATGEAAEAGEAEGAGLTGSEEAQETAAAEESAQSETDEAEASDASDEQTDGGTPADSGSTYGESGAGSEESLASEAEEADSAAEAAAEEATPGIGEIASGTDEESQEGDAVVDGDSISADGGSIAAEDETGSSGNTDTEEEITKLSDYTVMISADEIEVYDTENLMSTEASGLTSENEKVNYLAAAGLYDLYSTAEVTLTDQTANGLYTLAALLAAITALLGGLYFVRRRRSGEK